MGIATYILSYGAALLGVGLVAAYLYFTRNFSHWRKKGVKHLKPAPFVGNLKDVVLLRKNIGMFSKQIYELHKNEPYIGLFAFDEPVLQIHDLNLVKAILVKDFPTFCDRSSDANIETDPLAAKNIFGLKGDRWRHSRNAISPSFTSGKMKRMYELFVECGKLMLLTLEKEKSVGKPIPVYELAARYTTDVIASCAFGIQGNTLADPKAEFRRKLRLAFEFSVSQVLIQAGIFLAPKLMKKLKVKGMNPEMEDFIRSTIKTTVKEREVHEIKRNDLLDSLIELKQTGRIFAGGETNGEMKPASKLYFDDEDIAANSFIFLAAGFETSATTISYALYELAKHPDVQDKLRQEIQEASADGQLSYDALHNMKYFEAVFRETLRKYPPLPFLDRVSNKSYTLPGTKITLEEGSRILIPMHGFQMDPEFHPDPEKFDPERFLGENKKNIINYTHMPFGEGPRNCIGMRFAHIQTKSAVANLLRKYTVNTCSSTPQEIAFNPRTFLLQPQNDINLVFTPVE